MISLTSHMINGVEAYSKTPHFQRIVLLTALHEFFQVFPVAVFEKSIVLRVQSRALELSEPGIVQGVRSVEVWARIEKEGDLCGFGIICILNDFLTWEIIQGTLVHVLLSIQPGSGQ